MLDNKQHSDVVAKKTINYIEDFKTYYLLISFKFKTYDLLISFLPITYICYLY